MIIAFPVAALRAVAVFAARKDIRNYLNGVCLSVKPDETRIVATNGHCLGLYRVQGLNEAVTTEFELIIPIDVVLKCKATRNDPVARVTPNDDGTYMLESNGISQRFAAASGKFPDFARVVPNTLSLEAGSFDPHVASMFGDAAVTLGIKSTRVAVSQNGPTSSALVSIVGEPNFVGVMMPVQLGSIREPYELATSRPAWV